MDDNIEEVNTESDDDSSEDLGGNVEFSLYNNP